MIAKAMKTFAVLPLATALTLIAAQPSAIGANDNRIFQLKDVFELEYASDPQISPDGRTIAYTRISMDIMTDRPVSRIWTVGADGSDHRQLIEGSASSPRWSPDGSRLLYIASAEGRGSQIHLRWMDSGQTAALSNLDRSPSGLAWSPDGKSIAFTMLVPVTNPPYAQLPSKPSGAKWADPPRAITRTVYRADGRGFVEDGYAQVFVLPAEGGTPRRVTEGKFNHASPAWTPDSRSLIISANRRPDWELHPLDTDLYEVSARGGEMRRLTQRKGPHGNPSVSPDGRLVAFTGFDDRYQGYQVTRLYVMNRDGSGVRQLSGSLDRDANSPVWKSDSSGLYFQYVNEGVGKLAFAHNGGDVRNLMEGLGGLSLGRPYAAAAFSTDGKGSFAYTMSDPLRPADIAFAREDGGQPRRVTALNDDLFGHKQLGRLEEIRFRSSHDGREIQGWLVKPPNFQPGRKYPLVLEIHGGPFAAYGPHFAAEIQLFAAAGYVALYINPRGSTSYGEEFANLIHHNYPSQDYDDLISGVDAAIAKGYVDPQRLFVTGGSGGGVLTSWIVGKTDRFKAAVVAKPVINWYSFVLTADAYPLFTKYWFPGPPWEHPEHYHKRSPISLVGNVTTPTMLLTGDQDLRTPIAESEQYYQALKLRGVDTMLVRIPGASHGIASRPSQLIAKVAYILKWFANHDSKDASEQLD